MPCIKIDKPLVVYRFCENKAHNNVAYNDKILTFN